MTADFRGLEQILQQQVAVLSNFLWLIHNKQIIRCNLIILSWFLTSLLPN